MRKTPVMPGDDEADHPGPRSDPEAVTDSDPSSLLNTAARALVLGNALASPDALSGLNSEVSALGFNGLPRPWGGWEARSQAVEASSGVLARFQALGSVEDRERSGFLPTGSTPSRTARLDLWNLVSRGKPSRAEAIAWLRLLMTDDEPVAATAAASALSHWQKRGDVPVPEPLAYASGLLDRMGTSTDPTVTMLVQSTAPTEGEPRLVKKPERASGKVGTILHGTFAYPGSWWGPGGDFHSYIRQDVCSHVYSAGMGFAWSGAFKGKHRSVAAKKFADWAATAAGGHLCCVFAHSYGGIIAMMSTAHGVTIDNLVLLSVPAERPAVEWRNVTRAVSLRIHMDLALLAARRRQLFTENVEEFHLPKWFVNHGDSHDPAVWQAERSKANLGLGCP